MSGTGFRRTDRMAWRSLTRTPSPLPPATWLLAAAIGLHAWPIFEHRHAITAAEPDPQLRILEPGVRLTMLAEHPQLATPTGVDVDASGNVWVVATHTHFRPEDYDGPERDEILVFAPASDGDGPYRRRLFYNETVATMDLALGSDGWVYLAERGRILRVRDRSGDGRGDEVQQVAVLRTDQDYPHNGLSGLAWHPDGDLMFGLGENYATPWELVGSDGTTHRGTGEGGVFRCSPDGRNLRRVAHGFWNPFGMTVLEDGEIFVVDNDPGARPPCRLLHVVEKGDYGYQRSYGNEAVHPFVCWNGELPGTLPMIHPTGEAPCGVQPLGGGLLVPSWTDHRIDFYPLIRHGASYTSERRVLVEGGNDFRPVGLARDHHASPVRPLPESDGANAGQEEPTDAGRIVAFYFTDWVNVSYQLHGMGRLWKLEIDIDQATWLRPRHREPANRSARLARRLRDGEHDEPEERLFELARGDDAFLAQAALVGLSRQHEGWTPESFDRRSAADRVTAVLAMRIAARQGSLAETPRDRWLPRILQDPAAEVRFEGLRWVADDRLERFRPLVAGMLDDSDPDFRSFESLIATWNALEGRPGDGIRNTDLLLGKAGDESAPPRLRAYALRMLPTLPRVASDDDSPPRYQLPPSLSVERLGGWLKADDEPLVLEVLRVLAGIGTAEASAHLLALAEDTGRPPAARAEAVAGLASAAGEQRAALLSLASDTRREVREEALRALRGLELAADERQRVRAVAAAFPESGDLVGPLVGQSGLAERRPPVDQPDVWIERFAAIDHPADAAAGERLFHHSPLARCADCHRHSGRGNVVGPDLTRVGRNSDRTGLLQSLLRPNAQVAPEYRARMLVLNDGQVFTGIHLRTGGAADIETLRDHRGQERQFRRDEIEMSRELPTSLMPEGLAESLTDRELRDLLEFLSRSR